MLKRLAPNRVPVSRMLSSEIKRLFVKQVLMHDIVKKTCLTERVIRRVIKEKKLVELRERYMRYLCYVSCKSGVSLGRLAESVGVLPCALLRIRKKYGIPKAKRVAWNKIVTDNLEEKFILEYEDKTANEIAKKYGFKTSKTVLDVLRKKYIKRRPCHTRTSYREEYFEKIDSHDKAYILGLLYTDGYIYKDYKGFAIQLTESDGYILEKISSIMNSFNPLQKIDCSRSRERLPGARDMIRLTVCNGKISNDLRELGVVKRKTKILRYNGCVPGEFLSSFFRGLMDGDGCIHVKNGRVQIQLGSSSLPFLKDLMRLDIGYSFSVQRPSNTFFVMYLLGGAAERIRFLRWIYSNKGDLFLRRKYEKVQDKIS